MSEHNLYTKFLNFLFFTRYKPFSINFKDVDVIFPIQPNIKNIRLRKSLPYILAAWKVIKSESGAPNIPSILLKAGIFLKIHNNAIALGEERSGDWGTTFWFNYFSGWQHLEQAPSQPKALYIESTCLSSNINIIPNSHFLSTVHHSSIVAIKKKVGNGRASMKNFPSSVHNYYCR